MSTYDGLLRIFWPVDGLGRGVNGSLVGFRNDDTDLFVVTILQGITPGTAQQALSGISHGKSGKRDMRDLLRQCGQASLHVLGWLNPPAPELTSEKGSMIFRSRPDSHIPGLVTPPHTSLKVQIIMYSRPDPIRMQYVSLTPLSLALGNEANFSDLDQAFRGMKKERQARQRRKADVVEKLKLHTVISHHATEQEAALSRILTQVNCAYELNTLLTRHFQARGSSSLPGRSASSYAQLGLNLYHACSSGLYNLWIESINPPVRSIVFVGLMLQRIIGEGGLSVLEWQGWSTRSVALKDGFATAQQLDIRIQQACYWPVQYILLRKRKESWASVTKSHSEYIRFYNSLWLVANDVIIGVALGSFIIDNADLLVVLTETIINDWSIRGLRSIIVWLMRSPGGLKLNTELVDFLGDLFLWVIDYWASYMDLLRPHLPAIVYALGVSSFAGATMPISLLSDMVSMFTVHIYAFYIASARIFYWQLSIIVSLFHLFRGKKRNVLRNRIDSCEYDLDQLLLGTILFTLLMFLLPTVFVFYLTFATARVSVIGSKAVLELGLAFLNHFPLFALMLRLKDPQRLPGGICFELVHIKSDPESLPDTPQVVPISYIRLKSIPLSLREMFQPYFELGDRIRKHYLSADTFFCLASGQFVPAIERQALYSLQYSMLPAQRVGVRELWRLLNEGTEIFPDHRDKASHEKKDR